MSRYFEIGSAFSQLAVFDLNRRESRLGSGCELSEFAPHDRIHRTARVLQSRMKSGPKTNEPGTPRWCPGYPWEGEFGFCTYEVRPSRNKCHDILRSAALFLSSPFIDLNRRESRLGSGCELSEFAPHDRILRTARVLQSRMKSGPKTNKPGTPRWCPGYPWEGEFGFCTNEVRPGRNKCHGILRSAALFSQLAVF